MLWISIIALAFSFFVWRIIKVYDLTLNAYAHLMATISAVEKGFETESNIPKLAIGKSITWVSSLEKDRFLMRAVFNSKNIDKLYSEIFDILLTLNSPIKIIIRENSEAITSHDKAKNDAVALMENFQNSSIVKFIKRPTLQYLKILFSSFSIWLY